MDVPLTETPHFLHFVQWGFYGSIILLGWMFLRRFDSIDQTMHHVSEEMQSLNEKLIRIIEKTDWHERELEKQDNRITALERITKE